MGWDYVYHMFSPVLNYSQTGEKMGCPYRLSEQPCIYPGRPDTFLSAPSFVLTSVFEKSPQRSHVFPKMLENIWPQRLTLTSIQ